MRLFVEKTKKTLKTRFYFKITNVYKSFLHLLIFLKIVTKTQIFGAISNSFRIHCEYFGEKYRVSE